MASVGTQLKQARERLNLSVEEAAEKLRSSSKVIKSIENDNFGFLEPVYAKMFVKSYASLLKIYNNRFRDELDEVFKSHVAPPKAVYLVEEYEKELKEAQDSKQRKPRNPIDLAAADKPQKRDEKPPKAIAPPVNELSNPDVEHSEGFAKPKKFNDDIFKTKKKFQFSDINITNIIIYALILVGAVFILYFSLFNNSTQQPTASNSQPQTPPQQPVAEKPITNYYEKKDSLVLELVGKDTSWIRIAPDGKKPESFMIRPKDKKSYRANEYFEITVGKVGAVDIFRNGKLLAPFGRIGNPVSNVKITKDNEPRAQYSNAEESSTNKDKPMRKREGEPTKKKSKKKVQPEAPVYQLTPSKPTPR